MKTSIRWWSRLAFVAGVGLASLAACSSDKSDGHGEEKKTGTLALALQSTAASGSVYRLRNAFFQITDVRSGAAVQFLFSEDGLAEATELTATLDRSDYTVTLQPGWFLERVSGPTSGGGTGGSPAGFGGTFSSGGKASIPPSFGGSVATPAPPPFPGSEGGEATGGPASGGSVAVGGEGPIGAAGVETGGSFTTGGTSTGGSGSTGSEVVDAQLVSNAVQFFSIFGGDDEFVNYQFKVGGEIIDFNKGKLHVSISVDDSEACQVPSDVTKPERVLLESNVDAVAQLSLSAAFSALATNNGHQGDPNLLYQEVYDSYASAGRALLPAAIHCGDEMTNGVPSLNGFPIDCDRAEAAHVTDMSKFFATAFVNRIDLAAVNGAHCGQQRMIFANPSQGRAFMILEAQIPNPAPELGIDGCRPLAQFWMDQNNNPDAKSRGALLTQAFLQGGVKGLAEFGFGPFMTAENLTVGSGQIRTNQFDSSPWTLREFKLALDGDALTAVPFPVAESPHGDLWNEAVDQPQGDACRASFLSALDGVLTDNMSQMSFVVDAACKDAESRNDFSEDYDTQLQQSPNLQQQILDKLASVGSPLSADDVANRARFSGSCIGCHNEASGSSLGDGIFAPFSNDFPQVEEFTQQCADGETGNCFTTSNALNTVFLPGRLQVMGNLLDVPIIPNPCPGGGGGTGGTGGTGGGTGSMGFGGSVSVAGSFSTGGGVTAGSFGMGTGGSAPAGGDPKGDPSGGPKVDPGAGMLPEIPADPPPAPVVVIDVPPATEPVEQMQKDDAKIRSHFGKLTLSGKSAKSTH